MDKYTMPLGRMGCGLLIVMGSVSYEIHGSQGTAAPRQRVPGQVAASFTLAMATEKVPNDRNGDTWYLRAVREGNWDMVRWLLNNPRLNFNVVDNAGNTDLMLAIKGGEQDDFGGNYQRIFDLILHRGNRNWNLQNSKGQTALFLTVGWGRLPCLEALLQIDGVDPNIPNIDQATPLIAAIGNTFVSEGLRLAMALRFINHPRIRVNQRGTENKLPLQITFEAGLAPQLANAICRRSLVDYDVALREAVLKLIPQLIPQIHGEAIFMIQQLLVDERMNVNDYAQCTLGELVDAIRRKIYFLLNSLGVDLDDFPAEFIEQLCIIDANAQLFGNFLTRPDEANLRELFVALQ
jgi:hypothetical protein